MRELLEIQQSLKAPKGQRNNFGNYEYRSTEDILEAVKPLLKKHSCNLVLSDEIIEISGRFYVKATATFICLSVKDNNAIMTQGFAREPEANKGMNAPQITAMCSSYARKIALNGLFSIDDTKENSGGQAQPENPKEVTSNQPTKKSIVDVFNRCPTLELLTIKYHKAIDLGFVGIPEIELSYKENQARLQ